MFHCSRKNVKGIFHAIFQAEKFLRVLKLESTRNSWKKEKSMKDFLVNKCIPLIIDSYKSLTFQQEI